MSTNASGKLQQQHQVQVVKFKPLPTQNSPMQ